MEERPGKAGAVFQDTVFPQPRETAGGPPAQNPQEELLRRVVAMMCQEDELVFL